MMMRSWILLWAAVAAPGITLPTTDAWTMMSSSPASSSASASRRQFLGQTVAVAGAAVATPLCLPNSNVAAAAAATTPTTPVESSLLASAATAAAGAAPSKLQLPPMGLGCWSWGDSLFWGYNPKNDAELKEVFDYAVREHAPVLLDTAELYGLGRSEQLLGEYSQNVKDGDAIMASKFAPLPFRTNPSSVVKACRASVQRLGGKPIDLYQIHFPGALVNNAEYWDGMAQAYEQGLIKAVGVSNYGVDAMRACHAALAKRGIPLATNQLQYSLLYRYPEEDNGLLQACEDLGVQVLSYSPMALGLLTGKYNPDNVSSIQGPRSKLFAKTVGTPAFNRLLASMKEVSENHADTTNTNANLLPQVAINWCRAKGTIPIPGARNLKQVQSNYAALDWNLSKEEVRYLDQAAAGLSYIEPEASPMPKFDKALQLKMFDS